MTDSEHTIVIASVSPELDCGRYPVKREVGDVLSVEADIFKEGHDVLAAVVRFREVGTPTWHEAPMAPTTNDRWQGEFPLPRNTRYQYTVQAWTDAFASWCEDLEKKLAAGRAVGLELREGRLLVADASQRANSADRHQLQLVLANFDGLADAPEQEAQRTEILLAPHVRTLMARTSDRRDATAYDRELEVVVDRPLARCAAWYEMFARSQGTRPDASATFRDCEARLPDIRDMGFDVVYLPPIHPIGRTHRKGPNNRTEAGPDDPGSPYAIGAAEGGHKSIHPDLGTLDGFRSFVRRAGELGMEVALDFAIQCSPDHPYLKSHPEWFRHRPDGTIRYAENPPKQYEDIVALDFYGPHRDALWGEWRDVVLFWVGQGIRIFRVDNPHTKPIPFWAWLIREVQARHPDTLFLSEAFTRPKIMKTLAKAGFSQSYTYFTWRTFKHELIEYLQELTLGEVKEYLRPNFFTNTPDILPTFLQTGGRPAFQIRLVLAATLSSLYGIYNGFELCEAKAIPGTEEYLDSEKYQYKVWDWDRPGNIKAYIARINKIRRENPALHELENLRFHPADDDNILFYGKETLDGSNSVFVAVNLDPFEAHEATLEFPLQALGMPPDTSFQVTELIGGRQRLWRGARHRVRLDPESNPAEVYRITRWAYRDYVETCF
ncbi:MAG: alpha-1,4-glucan--maltose-1-phosphate maltosyltransferase [Betaproteobacteria bacterium]|nr:alpha-1,4-glucan--maltose-1-phosphate maltosyltransferase [Betaproteobacteria bacterium]